LVGPEDDITATSGTPQSVQTDKGKATCQLRQAGDHSKITRAAQVGRQKFCIGPADWHKPGVKKGRPKAAC
jgi:hypothetical protein